MSTPSYCENNQVTNTNSLNTHKHPYPYQNVMFEKDCRNVVCLRLLSAEKT